MSAAKIQRLIAYLNTQPDKPEGRQDRRAILVSDSKGKRLKTHYPKPGFPFELWCESSASCERLVDIIEEKIARAIRKHKKILIYFWGGTCDITEKPDKYIYLREQDDNTAISDILAQLHRATNIVQQYTGAQIKFVGIPTISIIAWNKSKGKTNTDSLRDQEDQVGRQVDLLNSEIASLNESISQNSLLLNKALTRSRKKKGKAARHSQKLTLLTDGVHPGPFLSLHWTRILLKDSFYHCYKNIPKQPQEDVLRVDVDSSELEDL